MTSSIREVHGATQTDSVQPVISHNVRILMAYKCAQQSDIGKLIGVKQSAISSKLAGRTHWTVDELVALSKYGGRAWPVARFLEDPTITESELEELTRRYIQPYIAASSTNPDTSPRPSREHLSLVGH